MENGCRSLTSVVPVQASRALDEQIDGREIGDHHVPVAIQGLLDHLGGDDDAVAFVPCAAPSEAVEDASFDVEPVAERKVGMEEVDLGFREVTVDGCMSSLTFLIYRRSQELVGGRT